MNNKKLTLIEETVIWIGLTIIPILIVVCSYHYGYRAGSNAGIIESNREDGAMLVNVVDDGKSPGWSDSGILETSGEGEEVILPCAQLKGDLIN